MSINEQVKELRIVEETCRQIGKPFMKKLISKVADTIEELSAKLTEANEELERWHMDKINEKIKNPFAQRSTIICHNCDHKDDYIEELEAANMKQPAEACGGWISCKDRLPPKYVDCLIYCYEEEMESDYTTLAWIDERGMWNSKHDDEMFEEYFYEKVAYWMPLPLEAHNRPLNQSITHGKEHHKPYQEGNI